MELSIEPASSTEKENFNIKVIVVGDTSVGKSNIIYRLTQDKFNEDSRMTVGVELMVKTYKIDDKIVKVQIWDTAGQERYKSMTAAYYKGAKGALLVYDITREETFKNIDKWLSEISVFGEKDMGVVIVGNKCDLRSLRAIEEEDAEEKAKSLGIPILETSAYDNTNVDEAFKKLILEIYKKTNFSFTKQNEGVINNDLGVKIEGRPLESKRSYKCC